MMNAILIVLYIFSVIYIQCAGCAVMYSCYKINLQETGMWFTDLTNSRCESYCKDDAAKNKYYGTSYDVCYCLETAPSEFNKKGNDECTGRCQGDYEDICGGKVAHNLITGSEIGRAVNKSCYILDESWIYTKWNDLPSNSLCEKQCKTATTNYRYYGTRYNICYCRETEPSDDDKERVDKCTHKCSDNTNEICGEYTDIFRMTVSEIGLSTETVTISNTETASTTSVSIAYSTTGNFIKMITSNTSPLIKKQCTPSTRPELFSTTAAYADTVISTVMTKTSSQATAANGGWSMWNDWKFCEVNCVREDTLEGTQKRWRTCNGSICSGKDMEERACSEPGICKGMRPRKLLCKCPRRLINTKWHFLDGKNITDAEVKKIVLEDFNKNIKSQISIDKKVISKELRKKNSSVNKRKSSQSIGWGCIVFLVLPMIFLIAIDILNCCIHFRSRFGDRKRNQIRPISNTQDQRDSTKPLQENVNAAGSYYASRCGNNFHPDEIKRETYQKRRDDNNQPSRDEWLQYI